MVKQRQKNFGTEQDLQALEERLLQLSEAYLSYKKRCYRDDPVEVLENLYCIKEPEDTSTDPVENEPPEGLMARLMARIPGFRGEGKIYVGINGESYRESELQLWSQAHPLLLVLRKKINEGTFDPNW